MAQQALADVVGREAELAAVRAFPLSAPAALLIRGEAGIGKTTLWRAGVDAAREHARHVLLAAPAEAEQSLSFAALGDLLEPVLAEVEPVLPGPQWRALAVALLLEEPGARPPEQRAVALAFLTALRALAGAGTVVVAVDDIQWLDDPTASVIRFALRRLQEEPIGFLLACRTDQDLGVRGPGEAPVSETILGPLSAGAVHRLLIDRLGLELARPRLRRLHELAGGNPFYALELGRAVQSGRFGLERGESLPGPLADLVAARLGALPDATRAALLAASALSQPSVELVSRAIAGDAEERLRPAIEADVVELDGERIRFTHPLLASGVYARAGPAERRALHRRLAGLAGDAEERAHHVGLGAENEDAAAAAVLEDAAALARSRGALTTAAELSDAARRLTPIGLEEERRRRTLLAADLAFRMGESDRARALLRELLQGSRAGPPRARALNLLGTIEEFEGDRRVAAQLFESALADCADDDALRAEVEFGLADVRFVMRTDLEAAARHARDAVAMAKRGSDRTGEVTALAEQSLVDAVLGRPEWRTALDRALALENEADQIPLVASPTFVLAVNLGWADELDGAAALFMSLREEALERAEESALPWILAHLGMTEAYAGRWEQATEAADEAFARAAQAGQEPQRAYGLAVRALVRACRGQLDDARVDAEDARAVARERGVMIAEILSTSALALVELSVGNPAEAHALLGPLGERLEQGGVREPGSARFLADDVEALIGIGRLDEAETLLERLEQRAGRLDRVSALAAAARCRGLLAAARGDLDGARESLERALAEHERVPLPLERGRTVLAFGMTRRRAKQRRAARESLEEALASFEELGARSWAERAQAELDRVSGRRASTGGLTASELQIARLAVEGRSNKEIAAAVFLTPKTVETKLSRIYAKVGVHSRTELAHRLTQSPPAPKL